jgi:uncharacterized protein YndB with AHSA1/START domain
VTETVSLDFELKSPIDRVWQALTDSETLSKWMMFDAENFEPVVGKRFRFRGKPATGWTGVIDGEVLEVERPHRLAYTWVGGPGNLVVHTRVTWSLTEAEGGVTRLHLEQSGFPVELKPAIVGARYGWTHMLEQLRSLLAAA